MASHKADLQTESRHSQFYEVKQVQQNDLRSQPDQSDANEVQNQVYEDIQEEDELQMVDLQKSRVLLEKYIKNKFSSTLHNNGQAQYKRQGAKRELSQNIQIQNEDEYEIQLSQTQNLKKIQSMIGEMIKSKIDSSFVTSSECNYSDIDNNIILQEQQTNNQEEGMVALEQHQGQQKHKNKIELQKAELALNVAQTCKEFLPNYEIGNIVCVLKRYLASNQTMLKKKNNNTNDLMKQRSLKASHNDSLSPSFAKQRKIRANKPGLSKQVVIAEPSQSRFSSKSLKGKMKKEIQLNNNKLAPSRVKVREQVQKEIAFVFVTKGYGLVLAKQHIKEDMDGNKYNSLLTSVIRSALRKLCDILTRNMGQQAKVFDMNEQRLLRSPMVNCRKWLNRSEQHTFFKIINIAYGMNNEPIYQDEVINLYQKLLKQLEKRSQYNQDRAQKKKKVDNIISTSKPKQNQTFQNNNTNNLKYTNTPSVPVPNSPINGRNSNNQHNDEEKSQQNQKSTGTPSVEKEIAELFVTFKSEDSVYLLLTKRHPKVSWDKKEIKSTLEKLIKIGLKKVLKFKKDHSQNGEQMPSLGLSQSLVGKILTHVLALQVRVAMVQVLMEKTLSVQRTIQLVNLINGCLSQLSRSE